MNSHSFGQKVAWSLLMVMVLCVVTFVVSNVLGSSPYTKRTPITVVFRPDPKNTSSKYHFEVVEAPNCINQCKVLIHYLVTVNGVTGETNSIIKATAVGEIAVGDRVALGDIFEVDCPPGWKPEAIVGWNPHYRRIGWLAQKVEYR